MESQNSQNQTDINKSKNKYWKFIAGFLGIIIVTVGGFFIFEKYFNSSAQLVRQLEKQNEVYTQWEEQYKQVMREDIYGGKTPEETLKMFIAALEKENINEASQYFQLETNEKDKNYLTRDKILPQMEIYKTQNKLGELVNLLSKLEPSKSNQSAEDGDYEFVLYGEDGTVEMSLLMVLNQQSKVWKIASL